MDRALDSFEVIEEEYAHLHPGEAPVTEDRRFKFPDQVRDAESLARIFCEAMEQSDQGRSWEFSKAHRVALAVLSDAPDLKKSVKQLQASRGRPATDAAARADLDAFATDLCNRFNDLIEGPLLGGPELPDPAFAELHSDAGVTNSDHTAERKGRANRLILQEAFSPAVKRMRDVRLAAVYDKICQKGHTALCLSGGGIRSATFALGVLTGLARHGLLGKFDYLSTVSGGGYIGSWLSAWMKHEGAPAVQAQLGSMTGEKLQPDPEPVRHLRAYSSYLTPKLGLLSADTWTLAATMIRNLLLNWVVVVPLLLSALLIPRLAVSVLRVKVTRLTNLHIPDWILSNVGLLFRMEVTEVWILVGVLYAVGFALGMAAIKHVHRNRPGEFQAPPPLRERTEGAFIVRCLLPLVIAASAMTVAWWERDLLTTNEGILVESETLARFAAIGLFMHVAGWYWGVRKLRRRGLELAVIMATGALGGAMSAELGHLINRLAADSLLNKWIADPDILKPRLYVTLAVPAFLTMIMVGSQLTIGLTSRRANDDEREWGARFNAWLFIVIVGWIALNVITLIVPPIIENAWRLQEDDLAGPGSMSGLIAFLSGTVTLLLGRSASTPATSAAQKPGASPGFADIAKGIALAVAAPVFAVSLVSLLSVANGQQVLPGACKVTSWCGQDYSRYAHKMEDATNDVERKMGEAVRKHPSDFTPPRIVLLTMLLLAATGLALGFAIDTNQFSLHAMYRNRLIRAYLRASRPQDQRAADPFTGFDKGDDLPIGTLWPSGGPADGSGRDRDERVPPLHVVNMTLNVVSRKTLGWQQRQAVSMAVSALHAGSAFVGYRRTSVLPGADDAKPRLYGGPTLTKGSPPTAGISLGTAMTISGAAASPEAGYNSSPAITFLMALFNARLGWWLGNPGTAGDKTFDYPCPRIGVWPLIKEMFGLTNKDSDFVFLSDGGHFENLGLYEMVLRRCRFILVSDGGCDPTASFEDLGNALRKIRIDFGVSIEFPDKLQIFSRDETPKKPGTYWAVGTIRYSEIDRPVGSTAPDADYDGILLYVKPALYGDEPADVDNYAHMSPTFPHESTADQFFTESQFESYRALGSFIVDQMVEKEKLAREKDKLEKDEQPGGNPSPDQPLGWLRAQRVSG
jgi:hypothetical protein